MRTALLLALLSFAGAALCDDGVLSLPDYQARLRDYQEQIQQTSAHPEFAVDFDRAVPPEFKVQTSSGVLPVPMEFLHKGLESYLKAEAKAKPTILAELQDRLHAMEDEAGKYDHAIAADPAARARLENILAAREFSQVRGPTAWELVQQRIDAWLEKLFKTISPKVPDIDQAGQVFVWVMIALVSTVLAVWLYRRSRDQIAERPREVVPFLPSAKNWRVWLAEAREQAAAGEWRDAIHLGYWAAVSRLESDGVWRPDKARTPREYLAAIPVGNENKTPFAAATRTFEAAWYGGRAASAGDFDVFMSELERLGCRG